MRIMCLDIGDKRVGIAITDESEILATPFDVLKRTNLKDDIFKIKSLVEKLDVKLIVIGLPYDSEGRKTFQAEKIERFAEYLKKIIPVDYYDERFSTKEALNSFKDQNIKEKKGKVYLDKVSASLILQGYIERRKTNDR